VAPWQCVRSLLRLCERVQDAHIRDEGGGRAAPLGAQTALEVPDQQHRKYSCSDGAFVGPRPERPVFYLDMLIFIDTAKVILLRKGAR